MPCQRHRFICDPYGKGIPGGEEKRGASVRVSESSGTTEQRSKMAGEEPAPVLAS